MRRHVFYVGGFFPAGPAFYRGGLVREAARYARVHEVALAVEDDPEGGPGACGGRFRLRLAGPAPTAIAYEILAWHDIVLAAFAAPWSWRLWAGAATLVGTVGSGAFARMWRLMRRFAGIWLFPFGYYGAAVGAAVLAGWGAAAVLAEAGPGPTVPVLGALLAGGLVLLAAGSLGRRCFAYLFLNDWIFSRAVALDRTPDLWTRLDGFADRIAHRLRRSPEREVVLVGHSFGASLAPLVVARIAERHPGLLDGAPLVLLTLGGSLPVIGFHPAAERFRSAVGRAASIPTVTWIDLSSSFDAINFKRFDPVAGLGLGDGALRTRSPLLLDTRIKPPGGGASLWRKLNLMRLHMQFVKASELPYGYDYIAAITCPGPIADALLALGPRPAPVAEGETVRPAARS